MSQQRAVLGVLLVVSLLVPGIILAQPAAPQAAPAPEAQAGAMLFVENAGQWPEAARFQVWGSPAGVGTTWLAEDAIWISIVAGSPEARSPGVAQHPEAPAIGINLKISFPGANSNVRIEPINPLTTTVSYFLGNAPDQWRPAVPVWGGVRYIDLYPGVDLVLGGHEDSWQLEAAPGASVDRVRLQVEGADILALDGAALQMDVDGEPLSISLPSAPFAYQASDSSRQHDPRALTVHLVPQAYQPARSADDPADLLYSTYLGGGYLDYGGAIAIDGAGSAYVTGITQSSDFPTTPGAFDTSYNSVSDAFAVKLNPAGSALAYATFLGGSGDDRGNAIVVDAVGSAYVLGSTTSGDFPTTPGAFDTSFNGGLFPDAFVTKLNPTGSELTYGTFLGGTGWDSGSGIAVDAVGSAHILGQTDSSNFPATPGAFDPSYNGGLFGDAFVAKLNPAGSALAYATFLGGSDYDSGSAIAVDAVGSAYVAGGTSSSDFPTTPGAFDLSLDGYNDAFVAKLNAAGSALVYATFLGGSNGDYGGAIAVDEVGSAYVLGHTTSSDFPTTPGVFDTSYYSGSDAFAVELNPAGSALAYATFLGGSGYDSGNAIAVDAVGSAYVAGETSSSDFPTTPGAFDASHNGYEDAFVAKLNATGSALVYATFLGGSGGIEGETSSAIAMDGAGSAYVTGYTDSSDFPTTPGAFDPSHNGGLFDAFVTKLDMYVPNVVAPIEQPHAGSLVSGTVALRGFAIDLGSAAGTGIDRVQVYLDGPSGTGTLIGDATYGLARADVAAQYGARFGPSGWELAWDTNTIAPGVHRLYLSAHRTKDNRWSQMPPHVVVVRADHVYWLPIGYANQ